MSSKQKKNNIFRIIHIIRTTHPLNLSDTSCSTWHKLWSILLYQGETNKRICIIYKKKKKKYIFMLIKVKG